MYLKAKAAGKVGLNIDVAELSQMLLDNIGKPSSQKKGFSLLLLACRACGVDSLTEHLLSQCEHKAKQRAVPALEAVRSLVTAHGARSSKSSSSSSSSSLAPCARSVVKAACVAAQQSDPHIRKAAMMLLVTTNAATDGLATEWAAATLRPAQMQALRELMAKEETQTTMETSSVMQEDVNNVSVMMVEKENVEASPVQPHSVQKAPKPPAAAAVSTPARAAPAPVAHIAAPSVPADQWNAVVGALAQGNWKDRLALMEKAIELVPGATPDQAAVLVEEMVAKSNVLANDSHSAIIAKSLSLLVAGIRIMDKERFAPLSKRVCLMLLDRLKENKAGIVQCAEDALNAIVIDPNDLGEILTTILASTVPKVRAKGLQWIEKLCIDNSKAWLRPALRIVVNHSGEAFGDQSADVRKAAASLMQLLATKWGREAVSSVLFGEAGVASKMGAARQQQIRKLLSDAPAPAAVTSKSAAPSPVAVAPVAHHPPPPAESRETTPVKSPYRPPAAAPKQQPQQPQQQQRIQPVEEIVVATSVAPSDNDPLKEWGQVSIMVEGYIRAMLIEKQRSEELARRCAALEAENAEIKSQYMELHDVAKALEDRAVELEEQMQKQPPKKASSSDLLDEIKQMKDMEQLSSSESMHLAMLAAIVQRKREVVDEMLKARQ